MAKLQDAQFIQIKVDDTEIKGSSEEKSYEGWLEGRANAGIQTSAGQDNVYFHETGIDILLTADSIKVYENYLKRGYKKIDINVVHRGSDRYDPNYEIMRTEYKNCKIHNMHIMIVADSDNTPQQFMHMTFSCEGSIATTFNVPNKEETALEKVGPVTYNVPAKTMK